MGFLTGFLIFFGIGAFLGIVYIFVQYFVPFCFLVLRDIISFFRLIVTNFATGWRQGLEADRARRDAASQRD